MLSGLQIANIFINLHPWLSKTNTSPNWILKNPNQISKMKYLIIRSKLKIQIIEALGHWHLFGDGHVYFIHFYHDFECRNPSLGLVTKVRACEGAGQEGRSGVTFHAFGNVGKCEGMSPTLPSELPFWELESWWTFEFSESDCKDQNPLDWKITYIIGKLLEHRCLKWARMTHLDTSNTSYGQKKGWESNWQFDSRPLKVRNRPDFLAFRWHAT